LTETGRQFLLQSCYPIKSFHRYKKRMAPECSCAQKFQKWI